LGPRESVRHAARQNLSIRQSEKRVNLTPAPWDARVVVLTIIPEEFAEARQVFGALQNIAGTNYFAADSSGGEWDIVVTRCMDRGNLCSGNEVRSIIDELRPTYLIVVGIAGGLCDALAPGTDGHAPPEPAHQQSGRDEIKVGDVLIANHLDYIEFLKVVDAETISHRQFAIDQPAFWILRDFLTPMEHSFDLVAVVGAPPEATTPRLRYGQIVSGEKIFSADDNPMQNILLRPFVKAIGIDMESVGVGRAIHEARHPSYNPHYVVIRGISDLVGRPGNEATRAAWKSFAARAAAHAARALVEDLLAATEPEEDQNWLQRLRLMLFPPRGRAR
jgi:nucleoside phosphorylase